MSLITSYASGQRYLINVRPYETCLPVLCEFVRMHILSLSFACSCVRIVGDESKVIRIFGVFESIRFRAFGCESLVGGNVSQGHYQRAVPAVGLHCHSRLAGFTSAQNRMMPSQTADHGHHRSSDADDLL